MKTNNSAICGDYQRHLMSDYGGSPHIRSGSAGTTNYAVDGWYGYVDIGG